MPIHDWTRVDAGLFHAFHVKWIANLADALNDGALPSDYLALPEQKAAGYAPDARIVSCVEEERYARKANRIAIHHRHGEVVSIIEIVSPGNKESKAAVASFVNKAVEFLQRGIHVLVIDLFPPGKRDPSGLHKLIWDEFREEPLELPIGKDRLLSSYDAGPPWVAYVEPVGVGDELPEMPLFLRPEVYIPTPLEATYQLSWAKFPGAMKPLLE